ncbi:polyprenyl synthetase family protein [Lactococcus termiticola]|nr:farnesyl diphosphate synthase [Lactococcus termiticola]
MTTKIERLERVLEDIYQDQEIPLSLRAACSYSLMAGGKRIRPVMMLDLMEAFGLELSEAHYRLAVTVEMIHTGSLIHDDLPAMDDDDYRRGKLTSHKQFDEATAILAGDALFFDPFWLLSRLDFPAEQVVKLVEALAYASGSYGMVAGQILDMAGEGKSLSLAEIEAIHERKTGRLLTFPFLAAGIVAGKDDAELESLRETGQSLGLAFQIRDDILDVTASFEALGKTPGKDLVEEKSTYVSILGLDEAKATLSKLLKQVKEELSKYGNQPVMDLIAGLEIGQ